MVPRKEDTKTHQSNSTAGGPSLFFAPKMSADEMDDKQDRFSQFQHHLSQCNRVFHQLRSIPALLNIDTQTLARVAPNTTVSDILTSYSDAELTELAHKIRAWQRGEHSGDQHTKWGLYDPAPAPSHMPASKSKQIVELERMEYLHEWSMRQAVELEEVISSRLQETFEDRPLWEQAYKQLKLKFHHDVCATQLLHYLRALNINIERHYTIQIKSEPKEEIMMSDSVCTHDFCWTNQRVDSNGKVYAKLPVIMKIDTKYSDGERTPSKQLSIGYQVQCAHLEPGKRRTLREVRDEVVLGICLLWGRNRITCCCYGVNDPNRGSKHCYVRAKFLKLDMDARTLRAVILTAQQYASMPTPADRIGFWWRKEGQSYYFEPFRNSKYLYFNKELMLIAKLIKERDYGYGNREKENGWDRLKHIQREEEEERGEKQEEKVKEGEQIRQKQQENNKKEKEEEDERAGKRQRSERAAKNIGQSGNKKEEKEKEEDEAAMRRKQALSQLRISKHTPHVVEVKRGVYHSYVLMSHINNGTHAPKTKRQLALSGRIILKMHSMGYVDGDRRFVNTIFGEDDQSVWHVDLDWLANENAAYYPFDPAATKFRTPDAAVGRRIKREHDYYSFQRMVEVATHTPLTQPIDSEHRMWQVIEQLESDEDQSIAATEQIMQIESIADY